jgi:transposase InsO family protein
MGWKVSEVVEQRFRFVEEYNAESWTLAELCRHYGISRPTAYKWLERYKSEGMEGLKDHSRAPLHHPQAVSTEIQQLLLAVKSMHPFWGARKILAHLAGQAPKQHWPAQSTVGEFLKQQGLTVARRSRPHSPAASQPLAHADAPTRVWSIDFKGWFRTGDGQVCYPLTLTDNYSRMLLRCQALSAETTVLVLPVLAAAFREYGLPERIRSDNGAPFGCNGQSGLSALSVWWLKLGIVPERIDRGCPQQNGRHERMHLTLKLETTLPPEPTLRKQQQRFDAFRREYNQQRPHEALGQTPPAASYQFSPRPYPHRVPEPHYDPAWRTCSISAGGKFRLNSAHTIFVSHVLEGEMIGLEPLDGPYSRAWFKSYELGIIDHAEGRLYNAQSWQQRQAREARRDQRRAEAHTKGVNP